LIISSSCSSISYIGATFFCSDEFGASIEIIEPVFTKIHNLKVNEGYRPLKDFDLSVFNTEELNTIKKVVELSGNTPSWTLAELSHNERAWIELNKTRGIIRYQDYAFDLSIDI